MAYGVPVYVGWDQLEAAVRKKARIPGVNPNTGLYGRSTPTVDEVYPRRARFPAWRTGVGRGSDAGACARASPPHLSFHSRVIPRVARDLHRPRTRRAAIGRLKEQGVEGTTGAPPVRPSPKSEGLLAVLGIRKYQSH